MGIQKQLFVGADVCLGPIDHENDPPIISRWSHDLEYLRRVDVRPALPSPVGQVKKRLEALEREMEESKALFHFTLRLRETDRLLGFGEIRWVEWTHSTGWVRLGIGEAQDRGRGYGGQALGLLLRYAFHELNLYRLSAEIADNNIAAKRLSEKAGFVEEVRRRQALQRDGQSWDLVLYGLLGEEWERGAG